MNRHELEHAIRAAGAIAGIDEIVVIGSQAILGSYPDAPDELTFSQEVDVYPLKKPEAANLIDGCIGELSPFHDQFGYYVHGVGVDTAFLPEGWLDRVCIIYNDYTRGVKGLCLSPGDLAISKLAAGREKDIHYVRCMLENNMVAFNELNRLFEKLEEIPKKNIVKNSLKFLSSE